MRENNGLGGRDGRILAARVEPKSAPQESEKTDNFKPLVFTQFQPGVDTYQAGSWTRPRKVVARLECSLQPDAGESTSTGMRQEVDIRYVVTSRGSAQYLYEDVYCQRGQMENPIKLHKA